MKAGELQPYVWKCEAPGCHVALRLLVRVNGELWCPGCLAEHEKRTR